MQCVGQHEKVRCKRLMFTMVEPRQKCVIIVELAKVYPKNLRQLY
jgi:hypothetical protein